MRNILEYLEKTAAEKGDCIAFCGFSEQITFSQLQDAARRVGSALSESLTPRQPVLVLTDKKISSIISFLGVVYAGCYYLPLDADLPQTRIDSIIKTADAHVIIGEREQLAAFSAAGFCGESLAYEDLVQAPIAFERLAAIRAQACDIDPLYVIFTSGSTGNPKGVITSHQAAIDYIEAFCAVTGIDDQDILGNQAPLDYVAAVRDIYIPLKTGAKTVLLPKKLFSVPTQLFAKLNEYQVTTLCWVAPAFNLPVAFHAFEKERLERVNKVIFTGSVMSCKTLAVWQQNLPDAFYMNHYGPTEITASCTYYIVDHPVQPDEVLPIGVPFHNTQILLITEDGKAARPGEKGEICVGGCCLALGYLNAPEQTAKNFVRNPLNAAYSQTIYRTGDIGAWDENGILWFYGRMDSQIKHMGHRVELSEIENAARAIEGISDCACLYDTEKENIYLFYEGPADKKMIAKILREKLPGFMVPRKFVAFEKMPKLQNGKTNLTELRKCFA